MRSKISPSNPYLRDGALRETMMLKSIASSSAIEGIRAPFLRSERLAKPANRKKQADKSALITD